MTRVVGLLLLLPLAGCAGQEVDIPGIESEIETSVFEQSGKHVTVDCPASVDWETGGEFHCIAEDRRGNRGKVTVTMENDEGDVIWEIDG